MGYIMGLVPNIPFSDVFLPSLLQCFALYDTESSKKGAQIAGMPSTGQTAREKHHGIYSISLRLFRSTRQRAEVHISINWGLREFHFSPPPSLRVFRKPGAELRDPPKGTSVHLSFIDHMLLFSEGAERSVKGNMRPNCFHHTQGRKLEPLPVTLTVIGSWSHFFCSG